jgi:chromosome segregation ATPase
VELLFRQTKMILMENLLHKLNEIIRKSEVLSQQVENLAKENRLLKARMGELDGQLLQRDENIESLKEAISALQLAHTQTGDNGREELKTKIDAYLHEIDECLKFFGE